MFTRNRSEMHRMALAMELALSALFLTVPGVVAQEANSSKNGAVEAAPMPEQFKTARKVFIGNAGVDGKSLEAFVKAGDISEPYKLFYTEMKRWGRYELVANPADADLVMEIRFGAPMTDCGKVPTYNPYMELAVLDAKTHFQLWTIAAPVDGAWRKSTWNRNVGKGAAELVENLKKLSGDAAAGGSPAK